MSSSKFEHSPNSEDGDRDSSDGAKDSRPPSISPWCNDPAPVPSSGPSAPLSRAPNSLWCDPALDSEDVGAIDEAQADTSPYPWVPHEPPQSSREPALPAALDPSDARLRLPSSRCAPPPGSAPESALVHSSGAFHTTRTAAAYMGIDPRTLAKQCRHGAGPNGTVADLGGGIVAYKVGRHWRIRFPWWQ